MDGAILVVAVTDGAMPQTKEHLLLANQVSPSTSCDGLGKEDRINMSDGTTFSPDENCSF